MSYPLITLLELQESYESPPIEELAKLRVDVEPYYKAEVEILSSLDVCKESGIDKDPRLNAINFSNFNSNFANRLLLSPIPSYDELRTLSCVLNTIVSQTSAKSEVFNSMIKRWRMRHLFQTMDKIGEESAFGVALSSTLRETNKSGFVVKFSQDEESKTDIIHEILVGTLVLNKLRQKIPNFAYVFGGYQCDNPVVDKTGRAVGGCLKDRGNDVYVIYENIHPSVSLHRFYTNPGTTIEDLVAVYLQLALALQIASEEVKFTHYDLHTKNVLVKSLPEVRVLKYTLQDGRNFYIRTDKLAVIIDYGMVKVSLPSGQTLGKPGHEHRYMFSTMDYPITDIIRLTYLGAIHGYQSTIPAIQKFCADVFLSIIGLEAGQPIKDNINDISKIFRIYEANAPYNKRFYDVRYSNFLDVILDKAKPQILNRVLLSPEEGERRVAAISRSYTAEEVTDLLASNRKPGSFMDVYALSPGRDNKYIISEREFADSLANIEQELGLLTTLIDLIKPENFEINKSEDFVNKLEYCAYVVKIKSLHTNIGENIMMGRLFSNNRENIALDQSLKDKLEKLFKEWSGHNEKGKLLAISVVEGLKTAFVLGKKIDRKSKLVMKDITKILV